MTIAMIRMALFALLALSAVPAAAQRAEVPIKAVTLPDGTRRYTVMLQIDGEPVEAGLDTGSTGLRVLGANLPRARDKGETVHARFNAGVDLIGPTVKIALGVGSLPAGDIRVGRIDKVDCTDRKPDCPVKGMDASAYRIMGDGIPGQGFVAIMGIGLMRNAVDNPLVQLGVKRWIVELPRSGDAASGRLILSPDDAEVARYRQFAMIPDTNMIAGCIAAVDGSRKICAPAVLDTVANGLQVMGGKESDVLPQRTPAAIAIGDGKAMVQMRVVIGRRDQMAGMRLSPPRADGKLSLSLGGAPYLYWSVLYDAPAHRIGVADRPN